MNILDEIMGPLGREYCNYFYIMGLLSFGLLSYMIVNIVKILNTTLIKNNSFL